MAVRATHGVAEFYSPSLVGKTVSQATSMLQLALNLDPNAAASITTVNGVRAEGHLVLKDNDQLNFAPAAKPFGG